MSGKGAKADTSFTREPWRLVEGGVRRSTEIAVGGAGTARITPHQNSESAQTLTDAVSHAGCVGPLILQASLPRGKEGCILSAARLVSIP